MNTNHRRALFHVAFGLLVIVLLVVSMAHFRSGAPIELMPNEATIEIPLPDSGREVVFRLVNEMDREFKVIGFFKECNCIRTLALPDAVGPQLFKDIRLLVVGDKAKDEELRFCVVTDVDDYQYVEGRIILRNSP